MSKLFNTKPVITDYDPPKPEPKTVPSFPTLPPMPDGPPLPPSNLYGQNAPEMIDYGQDSSYQEKEEEKEDFVQPEDSNDDSNNNNIQQILEKDPEILVAKGIEEQDPHNLTTGSELNKTNLSQNASFGQQSPEFNEKSNPQPDDNNDNSKNRNKMNDQDLDLRVTITNENVIDSNNEKRRESRDKDNKQEEFGNESRSNKRSWIPLDKPSKDERKRDRHERREKRSRRHSRSRSRSKSKSRDRERRDDDKSRSSSRREHRDRREDRERREDRDHRDRLGEKNSSRRDRDRDGHRSSDHKSRRSRSRSRSKSPKKEEKERKRPRKSRFDEPKNNTFGSVPGGPLQPTANISSQINHHPVAAMLTPYAAMYGMPPMSQMPSFTPNGHIIPNSVDPRTNKNSNNSQPHPSLPKEAFPGLPPPNFGLNLPAPNFNNMAAAAANPYHMANMQKAYVSDVPTPFPDSNNIGMMNAGMVNYDDVEYQGRVKKSKKDKKDKHSNKFANSNSSLNQLALKFGLENGLPESKKSAVPDKIGNSKKSKSKYDQSSSDEESSDRKRHKKSKKSKKDSLFESKLNSTIHSVSDFEADNFYQHKHPSNKKKSSAKNNDAHNNSSKYLNDSKALDAINLNAALDEAASSSFSGLSSDELAQVAQHPEKILGDSGKKHNSKIRHSTANNSKHKLEKLSKFANAKQAPKLSKEEHEKNKKRCKQVKTNCEKICKPVLSKAFKDKAITKDQYKSIMKKIVNSYVKLKPGETKHATYSNDRCKLQLNEYLKKYQNFNKAKQLSKGGAAARARKASGESLNRKGGTGKEKKSSSVDRKKGTTKSREEMLKFIS